MFTGLVVAVTVILLWFTSYRLFKTRNIINKEKVSWLALSAFMAGFGILCYGVRSLFIDNAPMDTLIYRLGITVHLGLSFIPAALFVYKNFVNSKTWQTILSWLTVIGSLIFAYGCAVPALKRVVKPAPFEPIKMNMSSYPWVEIFWKNVFVWFCIAVSVVIIWLAFSFSHRNKKEIKSASHAVLGILLFILSVVILIMPFAATASWYPKWQNYFVYFYMAFSAILIWLTVLYTEKKRSIDVALYYGLGIAYLLFPAMLCIFVTPIFARILYVPGAIFLFLALRREIKTIEGTA